MSNNQNGIRAVLGPHGPILTPISLLQEPPEPLEPPELPRTPKRRTKRPRLTRDQRIEIRTLYLKTGMTYEAIAKKLGITKRAVQYTVGVKDLKVTPQHNLAGSPPLLRDGIAESIVLFVKSSRTTRRMPATQITNIMFPDGSVGVDAVRSCLRRAGLKRRWAKKKPFIDEEHARRRMAFAENHKHWTVTDWLRILWSDETWATSGFHGGAYIWCEDNEVWKDDCTVPQYQQKRKWQFWGSFIGDQKGPSFFWDRNEHGTINQWSYMRYICPLIINFHHQLQAQGTQLIFMQDNAPGHRARRTINLLTSNGVQVMEWPANSPDLNPIENLWAIMKDWIADNYPEYTDNQEENKAIVQEAWDHIRSEHLYNLAASMPSRIQAVIDAKGYHTKY